MRTRFFALILFAVAFAFVEAAVVVYLRAGLAVFPPQKYSVILNLGFIAFVNFLKPVLGNSKTSVIEMFREFATLIVLLSVAFMSGDKLRQKIGAFLIAFSVWDIFYYLFLKILIGWPAGLFDIDIFFLLPVPWIGPVITALEINVLLHIIGLRFYSIN
jgi:hypothetical protein